MNEKIVLNERKSRIALILVLTILMQIFMPILTNTSKIYAVEDNTEELLTTITATGKEQASYSVENVATVSFSYTTNGSSAYMNNGTTAIWGWSLTVKVVVSKIFIFCSCRSSDIVLYLT